MKQCMDVDAINMRLKKIEGQVRGIQKMVNEDKPCEDILVQIGAVKAALHKTGQVILEGHMHHCVLDAVQDGHGDEAIDKLVSALNKFSKTL
ncbi:metal-sensitive transcriptional regulator [Chakrabartyella piscis]|uniref:metal-sensitive transcriptional regulator n=1 Tax=Chakrabartyella piscis TaxID=2918914 RepID=UPI0029588E60|nr:metal-sensitive transcriptional regulator [Chakrabartyella piscis]